MKAYFGFSLSMVSASIAIAIFLLSFAGCVKIVEEAGDTNGGALVSINLNFGNSSK